jgi:hypothetical protein
MNKQETSFFTGQTTREKRNTSSQGIKFIGALIGIAGMYALAGAFHAKNTNRRVLARVCASASEALCKTGVFLLEIGQKEKIN